jgi:hypothetical protein
MSVEEATAAADVVVIGKVVDVPEFAVVESDGRSVLRHNSVSVSRYLKGAGESTITVLTVGGMYRITTRDGAVEVHGADAPGQPQLLPVGAEVVLFLRNWGGGYMICSASHGVLEVQTGENGERFVALRFKPPKLDPMFDPLNASPEQLRNLSRRKQVSVDALPEVFSDILNAQQRQPITTDAGGGTR